MKKETKRLMLLMGVSSAVAAGVAYTVGRMLTDVAINRKIPHYPKRMGNALSGCDINSPEIQFAIKKSKELKELPVELVSTTSYDGLRLNGRWYPCDNPKRIIIAMHGWRSSWDRDYGMSFDFLKSCGCSMLFPDQRGQNDSDGEYIGFGVLERFDCLRWIKYVIDRFGTDIPIYLLGISMGATTVLMTSGFVLPAAVHGIIADCGFTSPHAIWSHVANNNLRISDKIIYPIANAIAKSKAKFDGDDCSTVDCLSTNAVPVLFIHGTKDTFVPIEMTFENYLACKAPKELFVVPGAGHGVSYLIDTPGYQRAVLDFFSEYDR